jgi:hypothetical protein
MRSTSNSSRICRRIAVLLFALASCGFLGCGSGHPKTIRVTGTVTHRGKPVEGANVLFECRAGRPAEAITDAAGRFTLTTFRQSDGAIGGEHTVVISKYVSDSGAAPAAVDDLRDPRNHPRQVIPARYTSPSQSPLKVKVNPGEDNDFRFDLTD